MIFFDTHTHLFLKEFDTDRDQVVEQAVKNGVQYMLVPNVDSETTEPMLSLCRKYPQHCFPAIGLHPTSVKENFKEELEKTEDALSKEKYYAMGEIGLDLYWDKTFFKQQKIALKHQFDLALKYKLPVILHSRDSLNELISIVKEYKNTELTGVFHCYPGSYEQALQVIDLGYKIGIGGVVTFKNSGLPEILKKIPLEHIILETDSPYLAPVPYRGKRNESAYIRLIAEKLAEIYSKNIEEIGDKTTSNALELFKIK